MGFLERAIRRGISQGVGKAVGEAITKAVEPKATEFVNKAATQFDGAAQNHNSEHPAEASAFEGAFKNLELAAQNYATEMSKGIKLCPSCGKGVSKEKRFCPDCGSELPEQTVAQGAVCSECKTQNSIGTKFCQSCGAKLPCAIQAEENARAKDEAVLAEWDERLSDYPKWCFGGCNFHIEQYDEDTFVFTADFKNDNFSAGRAVEQYRRHLVQNGFHQAGQYPDITHLYKKVGNIVYHVDTEHCFEGDSDSPSICFDKREPLGGYDYVKPQPKKQTSLMDLLKF